MSGPGVDSVRRVRLVTDYCCRGWRVVLLYGIDPSTGLCECDKGAECGSAGKHPRFKSWHERASSNPKVVAALLKKFPHANVGIVTGRGFGVVVDEDPRNGSDLSVAQMKRVRGPMPSTLVAATGGGGHHRVFAYPEGLVVGNGLPALSKYSGIDVKGNGGFIVVEPSVHNSGGRYEWVTPLDAPMADLPGWLLDGLTEDDLLVRPDKVTPYGWMALVGECEAIRQAPEGSRHETILNGSRQVGNLVGGGEIDRDIAFLRLEEAACDQEEPLCLDEIRGTIDDGLDFGAMRPRTAPPAFTSREDALASLKVIGHVVRHLDWKGHRGKRMYETLMAHVRIATRAGGPGNYWASLRNVAMEMGTNNHNRVVQGQRECREDGWLTMVHESAVENGRSWRLKIPGDLLHTHTLSTPALSYGGDGETTQHTPVAIGHDAFRAKRHLAKVDGHRRLPEWFSYFQGLGKTRYRIVDALWRAEAPMIPAELARTLGVARSTVTRNLPLLKKVGLVTETDGRLSAVEPRPEHLAGIASRLGTAGAALEQRELYEWESPSRREDLTATEAAALVLPETDPNPQPPSTKTGAVPDDAPAVSPSPGREPVESSRVPGADNDERESCPATQPRRDEATQPSGDLVH